MPCSRIQHHAPGEIQRPCDQESGTLPTELTVLPRVYSNSYYYFTGRLLTPVYSTHGSSSESSETGLTTVEMEKYLRFRCSVCEKICQDKKRLEIHMHKHTGAKPYVCNYVDCGARFSDPSNLNRHMKNVHMK